MKRRTPIWDEVRQHWYTVPVDVEEVEQRAKVDHPGDQGRVEPCKREVVYEPGEVYRGRP
jgi:hypothetical protein